MRFLLLSVVCLVLGVTLALSSRVVMPRGELDQEVIDSLNARALREEKRIETMTERARLKLPME